MGVIFTGIRTIKNMESGYKGLFVITGPKNNISYKRGHSVVKFNLSFKRFFL